MKRKAALAILFFSIILASCSSPPKQENKNDSGDANDEEGLRAERDRHIENFKLEIRRATVDYLAEHEAGWQIVGWSPLLDKELKEAFKPGPFGWFTAKTFSRESKEFGLIPSY